MVDGRGLVASHLTHRPSNLANPTSQTRVPLDRSPGPLELHLQGFDARPPIPARMSKQQMIEAIRMHNRSAKPDFLIHFDEQTLDSYLRRLTTLHDHRGKETGWVRQCVTPAVTARLCA